MFKHILKFKFKIQFTSCKQFTYPISPPPQKKKKEEKKKGEKKGDQCIIYFQWVTEVPKKFKINLFCELTFPSILF